MYYATNPSAERNADDIFPAAHWYGPRDSIPPRAEFALIVKIERSAADMDAATNLRAFAHMIRTGVRPENNQTVGIELRPGTDRYAVESALDDLAHQFEQFGLPQATATNR